MAQLELRNITRRFGDFTAADDISLQIESGEFFTLLGPSGCGKTTLLRMIAGFDVPDRGAVLLDGKDITHTPPEKRPVHTVFQSYALFPHLSVFDNIAFPLRMAGVDAKSIAPRVHKALADVRLEGMAERYPDALSGGQKQRVAIARALINRPKLLLLDEPLAALDLKLREQMQIELINMQKEIGITFVYVTHDQGEALALSHRIAVMNHGRIVQIGEPSRIYEFPDSRFVADFIGTCNLLEAEVIGRDGDSIRAQVRGVGDVRAGTHDGANAGARGAIALRPEKVRIDMKLTASADENLFAGTVHDVLYLGDVSVYRVETAQGGIVEALLPNAAARGAKIFDIGDAVQIAWHWEAGHFLAD